jgi:outer membrane receptor protein involved in Fe transport
MDPTIQRTGPPPERSEAGRRRVVATALLSALAVMAVPPVAAMAASLLAPPVSLAEALSQLQEAGLPLVFTSEVVRPEMTVEGGVPAGGDPRRVLEALLAPHGLAAVEGPRGVLVVVRGAPAGDCAVDGEVRDPAGRPLAGADVELAPAQRPGAPRRAETDAGGGFRFAGLPCGDYLLTARADGHLSRSARMALRGHSAVRVDLPEQPFLDEEIVVRPSRWSLVEDGAGGVTVFGRDDLEELPQLGGDALRVVALAPGVATSDVSASFSVRGGRRDEVEIRLDGQELYEPYHLRDYDSALSIVPSESLASMTLATGGLPAARGDRMGGVLELTTTAPAERRRARFGIGPLHALAASSGHLAGAAWSLTGRAGSGELADRVLGDDEPRFWDAFGRLDVPLGQGVLAARALAADDSLEIERRFDDESENVGTDYASRYGWLSHETVLGGAHFLTSRASWARTRRDRRGVESEEDESFSVRDVRHMQVLGLSQAWAWQRGERTRIELGAEAQRFDAELDYANTLERPIELVVPLAEAAAAVPRIHRRLRGDHLGLWASQRATLGARLTAELGLRYDRHTSTGDTLLSPRLNTAWRLGEDSVLRASWGVFHQSQRPYELAVEDGQSRLAEAERSRQWVVGYERLFAADARLASVRVEAFGRAVGNPRERFVSLFEPVNIFPETEPDRVRLVLRESAARGLELLVRGGGERLSWWLSYAYTDSTLSLATLSLAGSEVPATFDQPHAVTLDVGYRLIRGWNVNAAWHYHTGWPTTPLVGLSPAGEDGGEAAILELGRLNSRRLPPYHRLDLRIYRQWPAGRSSLRFFVDVQNVYDRENLAGFDPDFDVEEGTVALEPELWPGIVPSFGIIWEL